MVRNRPVRNGSSRLYEVEVPVVEEVEEEEEEWEEEEVLKLKVASLLKAEIGYLYLGIERVKRGVW